MNGQTSKQDKKYISDSRGGQRGENEDCLKIYDTLDIESLSVILDAQPDLINKRDEKTGWTLLFRAVLNSNYSVSEFLLERNADPNVQNVYGETPLHHAVENSNHKIINLLLEKGANPNVQQMDGETPMHIAAVKGDYKIVKLLNLYGGDMTIGTFEYGYTALDYANERGDKKCLEVLEGILIKQRSQSFNNNVQRVNALYNGGGSNTNSGGGQHPSNYPNEGFQTTKNSQSPIHRIRNHINMEDPNLQGINPINTSKHSKSKYHQRHISQNYPSFDVRKQAENMFGFNPKFHTLSPNREDEYTESRRKLCSNLQRLVQGSEIDQNDEDYFHQNDQTEEPYNDPSNPSFYTNSSSLSPNNSKSPTGQSAFQKRLKNINKLNKVKKYGYDASTLPTYLNYVNLINNHNSKKHLYNSNQEESTRLGANINNTVTSKSGAGTTTNNSNNTMIVRNFDDNNANPGPNPTYYSRNNNRHYSMKGEDNVNYIVSNHAHEDELLATRITHTTHQNTFMRTDEVFNFPLKRENSDMKYMSNQWINEINAKEIFEDYNKVLAVFISTKNDINEYYVKKKGVDFKSTIQTKKTAELFNFNLEEMNEFIMKTEDNNKRSDEGESDEEEEDEEEERIINDFILEAEHNGSNGNNGNNENTTGKYVYPENLTGTFYSKNFTFKNCESKNTSHKNMLNYVNPLPLNSQVNSSNVKYFSKSGRSMKDEFKQISLDTQNINEMTIYQKCPDTDKHLVSNETLDKMNINFEMIRRNGSGQIEMEYNSTEAIREINSFMKVLDLERYTCLFVKNGFDDLGMILDQMKSDMAITDQNLKDIGILIPGHRAKILLKLEEECNNFGFPLPPNVYYCIPDFLNISTIEISSDPCVIALYNWLVNLKLEQFVQNFIQNGYQSLELLFMQMNSKNPLTEKILEEEVGVDKIGYRIRILNKLRDDSKMYMNKLKSKMRLSEKRDIHQESCTRCVMF